MDRVGVTELRQGLLDVGAAQQAIEPALTALRTAPAAFGVQREIRTLDPQTVQIRTVLAFGNGGFNGADRPILLIQLFRLKVKGRNRSRIGQQRSLALRRSGGFRGFIQTQA
jgi:hypothetical protein